MNTISGFNPAICPKRQIISQKIQTSPTFGHLLDYHDPEDIKEAREHGYIFRDWNESDEAYEARVERILKAREEAENPPDNRPFWKKMFGIW